jgi:uncharacterized repeat protein (TIGR01451 family)/fimbrial isopeptide formation D2 family protein
LTVSTLAATSLLAGPAAPAQAAPGNPGTPSDPTTVYTEDFQNVPGTSPVQTLTDYTGTSGQKYTANDAWLTYCNGLIASTSQSPTDAGAVAACGNESNGANGQVNWNRTQQLSYALGLYRGGTPAAGNSNYADSAYTANNPGAGLVEFETATNIPFAASNRFITFSADVAAINCAVSAPQLQFQLLNDAGVATNVGTQVNACTSTNVVNVPAVGAVPALTANVGTTSANNALLFSGTSIGVRMLNNNGSGAGNDHAIDNIRILDVTPQLDKQFSPARVETGGTSTLTFTVTNTSELGSKAGWSFTDNLPDGLTLANSTVGGTCDADTAATAGATSVAITDGNLAAGETSCTITVQVTAAAAGSYTNGPDNITPNGLVPPADTTVTFTDPSYTVAKTADVASAHPGDTVTYSVVVTNTGEWAYTADAPDPFTQASFTDDLSEVLDDATYVDDSATQGAVVDGDTLSWSGDLGVGESKTITYAVTVNNPDTGDEVLENTVTTPPNTGGACAADGACGTNTPVQSYSVAKTSAAAGIVHVGSTVSYTVTVTNTGVVDYTDAAPASFTDDLSEVLDDAAYNGDASEGATVDGDTLSWSGPLQVGESVDITYSVTVRTPDAGDGSIENAVTVPAGNGGGCATEGGCQTTDLVGAFTVQKTSDKAEVGPGGVVHYEVTVTNTGKVDYTTTEPASFTDDLSKVTDDATYNRDASSGATVRGDTLSWAGALAQGKSVTVAYSFTVNSPDTGDRELTNVVDPSEGGSCATTGGCTTNTTVDVPPTVVTPIGDPAAPAGPSVATGGTVVAPAPVWPWIGSGIVALAGMVTLGVMVLRRRQDTTAGD